MRPYSPGGALNTFAPAEIVSEPPLLSAHRLGPGLPGYLIPFAPLAFAPQRQLQARESLSPPAFLLISTHFTAPPGIPLSPPALQFSSIRCSSSVEPRDFTNRLTRPPTSSLCPVIPNNVRTIRITAAAGTYLAGASSSAGVRQDSYSPPAIHSRQQGFTTRKPSSPTRRRSVTLARIAEDSRLQPPVGVWAVSQSQCGRSPSQAGYPSSPW